MLTKRRLDETVPIGNAAMKDRTFIEWDKDDIDSLGLMKVDILALGMLTCHPARACDDPEPRAGARGPAHAPWRTCPRPTTPPTMICKADTLGVFQVESRAQMSMLPRLKPADIL